MHGIARDQAAPLSVELTRKTHFQHQGAAALVRTAHALGKVLGGSVSVAVHCAVRQGEESVGALEQGVVQSGLLGSQAAPHLQCASPAA